MLLGFAGLVYGLFRHALYDQTDRTLRAALTQAREDRELAEGSSGLAHWFHEIEEHQNLVAVAYDHRGKLLGRTADMPSESMPAAPAAETDRFQDMAVPGLGRQRTVEGAIRLGSRTATLLLMTPLAEVDHELARLRAVLLTAVLIMLLLGAAVAYGLARKALSPVQALHRSTEKITANCLDRRISIPNPGDELGRLAQTLNAMIARLEHSFAEIRRFTADASHELRTPLTAIRTEAEVALGRPLNPADCQQLLGSILEECDRLTRLTDQLLTLAREDTAPRSHSHEVVNLPALLKDVADTMRPLAESKGLELRVAENGHMKVSADALRLRQVFINVLDNAIKYTPEGRVDISYAWRERAAVITIADTGVGITPEHLPRVFDRFYRVDKARSREQGGTGLGLSIAQSIVSAHGGTIELISTPGRGTTCTITLPDNPGP